MQQGRLRAVERMPATQVMRPHNWRWMQAGDVALRDRFTVQRVCRGEGPGNYYLANDGVTGDDARLRALQLSAPPGSTALVRLRHDVRRVATSPHPHILRVLDHDAHEDMLLFAMDLPGTSLREVLAQRRLALSEALLFAQPVGAALAFAHAHGVQHGLLTPATIDIFDGKSARVGDFGLLHLCAGMNEPCPADIGARPGYLPPEVAQSEFPQPTYDIFQLGALLWEMSLGEPPPTIHALRLLEERGDLPDEIRDLIAACMQPDPADRPQQVNIVLRGIRVARQMLAGKPSSSIMVRLRYQRANTVLLDETQLRLLLPPAPPLAPISAPSAAPDDESAIGAPPPPPAHLLQRPQTKQRLARKLWLMAGLILGLALAIVAQRQLRPQAYAAAPRPSQRQPAC